MKTKTFLISATFVITLVGLATVTTPYWTHGSKVVEVTGTTTKRSTDSHGNPKDVYLVFTTDGTYRNEDSFAYLKYNSSDVQGKLIKTGKFKIDYYGVRVPLFSKYKNIISAKPE